MQASGKPSPAMASDDESAPESRADILPEELWLHILKDLGPVDLQSVAQTSKLFHALSQDPVFDPQRLQLNAERLHRAEEVMEDTLGMVVQLGKNLSNWTARIHSLKKDLEDLHQQIRRHHDAADTPAKRKKFVQDNLPKLKEHVPFVKARLDGFLLQLHERRIELEKSAQEMKAKLDKAKSKLSRLEKTQFSQADSKEMHTKMVERCQELVEKSELVEKKYHGADQLLLFAEHELKQCVQEYAAVMSVIAQAAQGH